MANHHRRRVALWVLAPGLIALLGLQLLLRQVTERFILPTRDAQWIWISNGDDEAGPVAFYAVRDFDLEDLPRQAVLTAVADEEALIFLNAVPIGGGRYRNGDSLKSYEVVETLQIGRNRLVVEVRSERGVGGLLMRLEIRDGERVEQVVTDGEWTVVRQSHEALFDRSLDLPEGESPKIWGPVPVGRWLASARPVAVPTIADLRTTQGPVEALRFRLPDSHRRWQSLGRTDRSSPALGRWVTFDFGRQLVAYLALRFPSQVGPESRPIGVLYLGDQPRILNRSQAERHVVIMPGQRVWLDAQPRRFRYATYVGLTPVSGADAYPVDDKRSEKLWAAPHPDVGAFGLPVGPSGPSLEDVVWSELHRLSRLAGRE